MAINWNDPAAKEWALNNPEEAAKYGYNPNGENVATNAEETATPAASPGMSQEEILRYLGEIQGGSEETQMAIAQMGVEGALEQQKRQQEFLDKASGQAIDYYTPFREGGQYWLQKAKDQIEGGAPKYSWDKQFTYDTWKTPQTWDEYSKTRLTPEGAKTSPYYGLYQFQKEQQDLASNKALRARGLYGSGAGMKEALNKQSGIDENFTANEYNRALGEYQQDTAQKLQEHNIGYEEAKQKYGMSYDQYNKAFGVEQGQWTDKLNTNLGLGDYAYKAATGMANARIGQGNQLGQGAIQTGNTIAGLMSSAGSGIGASYNAQGNQAVSSLNNANTTALGYAGLAAGQQNYSDANATNLTLGGLTAASGIARSGIDAYRYYNKPSTSVDNSYYDNYGYGTGGGVGMEGYNNILDSSYGGSYGL
jgi:hypothetical protein